MQISLKSILAATGASSSFAVVSAINATDIAAKTQAAAADTANNAAFTVPECKSLLDATQIFIPSALKSAAPNFARAHNALVRSGHYDLAKQTLGLVKIDLHVRSAIER